MTEPGEPPEWVEYSLEEALDLLAVLEGAAQVLTDTDQLADLAEVQHQMILLSRKLGFDDGTAS